MKLSVLILTDQPTRPPTPQRPPKQTLDYCSALSANSECFFLFESEQQNFGIYLLSLLSKNKNDILELLLIPMIHMSDSLHSSFQAVFFLSISRPNGEPCSRHIAFFLFLTL